MKNQMYNKSFSLLKYKNERKLKAVSLIVAVSFFLLSICTLVILLNVGHINHNLMNNNSLMLIQMFGQSSIDQSCHLDISLAEDVEHVVFATESFPLSIALFHEDGRLVEESSLVVHRIDPEFSEYFGISEMQEGVIYSPADGIKDIAQYTLQEPYNSCNIKLANYNGVAPAVLQNEEFAAMDTYDRLRGASNEEEIYFSTPEYLIGVDSTENVYSVIRSLNYLYPDYELKMFYQAQGLERLVSNSKNMVYIELAFLGALAVSSYFIIQALMNSMVNALTKEMMIMHMHGVSRKKISEQFLKFAIGVVKPKLIIALGGTVVFFLWMCFVSFREEMGWVQLLITVMIVFIVCSLNVIGLKRGIYKKVCENTSNENISGMLRN